MSMAEGKGKAKKFEVVSVKSRVSALRYLETLVERCEDIAAEMSNSAQEEKKSDTNCERHAEKVLRAGKVKFTKEAGVGEQGDDAAVGNYVAAERNKEALEGKHGVLSGKKVKSGEEKDIEAGAVEKWDTAVVEIGGNGKSGGTPSGVIAEKGKTVVSSDEALAESAGASSSGSGEAVADTVVAVVDKTCLDYRKPAALWNTVLFFPDKNRHHPDSTTNKLMNYLLEAKMCIQICLFLASLRNFERIILQKKREGLVIQVITDHDTMEVHNNYNCRAFQKAGIPVFYRNTGYFMHNKFIIIDDEALLTGSMNFTAQAIMGNLENMVVTTDPRIVSKYREQYAYLLMECEKADRKSDEEVN